MTQRRSVGTPPAWIAHRRTGRRHRPTGRRRLRRHPDRQRVTRHLAPDQGRGERVVGAGTRQPGGTVPTPATIHDAQNADQKEAVIPGASQIATYTRTACPTRPARRTASQPIRVAMSASAGRNPDPAHRQPRSQPGTPTTPPRSCPRTGRPRSPTPRTTPHHEQPRHITQAQTIPATRRADLAP